MSAPTTQQSYGETFSSDSALNYERYFVPVIPGPFAADLIAEAGLEPGERVLDVACGTGIVARLAVDIVGNGNVAGLDVTPEMLVVARSITHSSGKSIRWYESTAEAMPLPESSFDVVLSQLGLMFVPDQQAAAREMRRVLAPGGRAYVSTARPSAFFEVFHDALARHIDATAAGFMRQVFSFNDPAAAEQLFLSAGFREAKAHVVQKTVHPPPAKEWLWQYIHATPIAPIVMQAGKKQIAALERDVVDGWKAWTTDDGLACDQELVVVAART
jgi:ubiquinone/menaquinone biosynthesis C-methylase UbiE